jgi:hypothetical protein
MNHEKEVQDPGKLGGGGCFLITYEAGTGVVPSWLVLISVVFIPGNSDAEYFLFRTEYFLRSIPNRVFSYSEQKVAEDKFQCLPF